MAINSNEHIVMLPFMAHGHQIPFLALATKIQQKTNFTVTIATTPLNIKYLHAHFQTTNNISNPKIRLAELPFCGTDFGLPPNVENTEDLPLPLIINLCRASTTLEAPVRELLVKITEDEGKPPICVISDAYLGWANNVAKSLGTINATFTTTGAYGSTTYASLWQYLPHRNTDADEFTLPGFPTTSKFPRSLLDRILTAADGTDEWSKFLQTQISLSMESCCCLINTVEEIEILGLQVFRNYVKAPVFPIGPLLPAKMLKHETHSSTSNFDDFNRKRAGKELGISPDYAIKWLDGHKKGSVLYISFGSQNTINRIQMMELAKGLELSKTPFIWVIRPPLGFNITSEFKPEWLPENFETRITETNLGLMIQKWAPQLEILAHESTGGFISHCGWNSVLESLSSGIPIIGWPLTSDQPYNSKMLVEEMGVGVELCRGFEGVLTAETVKNVVKFVMGENGAEIRKNVEVIKEMIRASVIDDGDYGVKGSSVLAMDHFIDKIVGTKK